VNSDTFVIKGLGGRRSLKGSVSIGGAKNAALKVLAASILFRDGFRLTNVPDIEDVLRMNELLEHISINNFVLTLPLKIVTLEYT